MLKPIVFWGASGHAKVLHEFIAGAGYELVAMFDNNREASSPLAGTPLYYGAEGFARWANERGGGANHACLVAIGGSLGRARLEIQRFLEAHHLEPVVAIHPTAFVAANASVSKGSQILARASVCAEAVLGEGCIVNTASSVDHETVLGDGVHIAPGATLAGCVSVGDYSLVGPGAVVLPRIRIGRDCIVGAGAVVTKDVPDGKVVYGNPATIKRDHILS
ncbi:MAG TPA: acetyltransferase [Pyrinomonadaceae bacterium]|jgi:sugar O-acyltransferase (sialic acid O-acetyltransferase NeuD family)